MRGWFSEYHPLEVRSLDRMPEVPEAGDCNAYAAEVKGEGVWSYRT